MWSGMKRFDSAFTGDDSLFRGLLYISGYADNAFVHRAGHPSDIVFLPKPFMAGGLLRKVREALDR
jgi:hypothetical protein